MASIHVPLLRANRRNEIIALRKGSHKHVFRLVQFIDGRPIAGITGISGVLSQIANRRAA
ncbi:antitoxin Xre/MbcA/ParS-like domain-containing protein [Mesorhizobium shonense]|uniref:antitoxin Xre/MbcA/ParS-like domain-containing protein n=1 Tax=Mesorhizobium shonense TaxID=1209948 RepID=UPI003F4958F9